MWLRPIFFGMFMSLLLAMYFTFLFLALPTISFLFFSFSASVFNFFPLRWFQYNFEGRYDLVRFIKTIQKAGLYAHIRIGPYVCAEWNFGYQPIFFSLRSKSVSQALQVLEGFSLSGFFFLIFLIFFFFGVMFRGFPVWLKYVPGISFRTDNEPFKVLYLNLCSMLLYCTSSEKENQ